MIEFCLVFTTGGILLWRHEENEMMDQPVDHLIMDVLLEDKQSLQQYTYGDHVLKWKYSNSHKLYVVVGYLPIGMIQGVDGFVNKVSEEFIKCYGDNLLTNNYDMNMSSFVDIYNYYLEILENNGFKSTPKAVSNTKGPAAGKPKGKVATKWSDSAVSTEEARTYDLSQEKDTAEIVVGKSTVKLPVFNKMDNDDEEEAEVSTTGGIWNFMSKLVGSKALTAADLADMRQQFVDQLIQKNVTADIANILLDGVVQRLIGRTTGSMQTFHQLVRKELEIALERLLSPAKKVDVMIEIGKVQQLGRPYSIVMCGVNGVGKSTSLAKLAAYFSSQGLKVGVVACDTFRSGAIEQLKTHCCALGIPLYDKGYGRDEATVASEGIMNAKRDGIDVVLIDTAGRMQGNEGFMKGLAKLMNVNNPDLILFVGEALVGNDGCDQLINFNRALANNSGKAHPRLIDGIVLTKYDTVDDKCGAAISMIHSTNIPILFVGVGQTYADIKRPSAKMFINALLK